jgi:hypothetical protein
MSLRDELKTSREGGFFPATQFRVSKVKKARALLASKFTEAESLPPVVEIVEVAERLAVAAKDKSLQAVSRKDWKKAGWCLWIEEKGLARDDYFLNTYLDRLATEKRRSSFKRLISAYVREYGARKAGMKKVGEFIASGVHNWEWVWADRQRDLQFFEPSGPRVVAAAYLSSKQSADSFLDTVGLGGELGVCGYAYESFAQCLSLFGKLKVDRAEEMLPRVLEWAMDEDGIRYPGLEGRLADALLLRWANTNPSKRAQKTIEVFLLKHFGDPRVASVTGSKWHHVSEDAKSIMLRWLVGAALEQFLQVVDKVAMPSQWKYRRAFWTAYYKAGVIDEAWVAFAWQGQVQARKSFGSYKGFGKLEGSGVSNDHAVLLMKIGSITIADWSHNGKCHIWTQSMRKKPKLYRKEYGRPELVEGSSNKGVVHAGAPNGTWQAKIASYIARHTGIRLGMKDYMPKRRR